MTNHVTLEQKRRQKINQQFRDLSVLLPSPIKMDKTSVLIDCIKYINEMEQSVKELEEIASEQPQEAAVFMDTPADTDSSSTTEDESSTSTGFSYDGLLEIQTRVSGRDVLIQIHCENRKGILVKIFEEIEKRSHSILNSNVMSFGTSNLTITVVAKMRNEFNMDVKDLVNGLRSSFAP